MSLTSFVKQNNIFELNRFLCVGADPNLCDSQGTPPLFAALDRYIMDRQLITSLIKFGDPNVRNSRGENALHYVARVSRNNYNLQTKITFLIKQGVDPKAVDNKGNTPADICRQRNLTDGTVFLTHYMKM
jgi:ankyrin repeat protein